MQRILVVDDEEDLCEILRFNLEAAGYEVDTAHSAEEALSIIDKHSAAATHHDLLLLDIMMDRMSGIELATQLRRNGNNTPVIFLTALGGHDDQIRGFDAGADDYIAKPFSFDSDIGPRPSRATSKRLFHPAHDHHRHKPDQKGTSYTESLPTKPWKILHTRRNTRGSMAR